MFHPENVTPRGPWTFVFASDTGGRHAHGYAKIAKVNFGAKYGVCTGPMGSSYAIPVHDRHGDALPEKDVAYCIEAFLEHAKAHPKQMFFVTSFVIGGESTRKDAGDPICLFANATENCSLPDVWREKIEPIRASKAQ